LKIISGDLIQDERKENLGNEGDVAPLIPLTRLGVNGNFARERGRNMFDAKIWLRGKGETGVGKVVKEKRQCMLLK
jgi:hypothetical protein